MTLVQKACEALAAVFPGINAVVSQAQGKVTISFTFPQESRGTGNHHGDNVLPIRTLTESEYEAELSRIMVFAKTVQSGIPGFIDLVPWLCMNQVSSLIARVTEKDEFAVIILRKNRNGNIIYFNNSIRLKIKRREACNEISSQATVPISVPQATDPLVAKPSVTNENPAAATFKDDWAESLLPKGIARPASKRKNQKR